MSDTATKLFAEILSTTMKELRFVCFVNSGFFLKFLHKGFIISPTSRINAFSSKLYVFCGAMMYLIFIYRKISAIGNGAGVRQHIEQGFQVVSFNHVVGKCNYSAEA